MTDNNFKYWIGFNLHIVISSIFSWTKMKADKIMESQNKVRAQALSLIKLAEITRIFRLIYFVLFTMGFWTITEAVSNIYFQNVPL